MARAKTKPKLIALTGATGFVGGHILKAAVKAGYQVRAITRRPQNPRPGVDWVPGDLKDRQALKTLLEDADVVIHCAGIVKARRHAHFHEINTQSLAHLLDMLQARRGGYGATQVMFISSLTARHPDISPYAMSKHNAEEILKSRGDDFPWTIIRPPAVYGPGDMEILKLFRVMKRGFAPVAGSIANSFSLIHGRDLAAAVLAAIGTKPAENKTLEPDDRHPGGYTVLDVAGIVGQKLGRAVKPVVIPGMLLHAAAFFNEIGAAVIGKAPIFARWKVREMAYPNWVSNQASHAAMPGWKPKIGLKEGLNETIDWYQANDHL